MKRAIFILSVCILVVSCLNPKFDSTFSERFITENGRVRGELYRFKYHNNLESLTYDYYLHFIDSCKIPSVEGLVESIRGADKYYFETRKNSFLIALLYKKERTIFVDNAYTSKLDTIYVLKENESFPVLKDFAHKIKF